MARWLNRYSFASLAVAVLACGAPGAPSPSTGSTEEALIGGQPYTSDDSGALWLDPGAKVGGCSGVWLGSRYVLTAAHCVQVTNPDGTGTGTLTPAYQNGGKVTVYNTGVVTPGHGYPLTVDQTYIHPTWAAACASQGYACPAGQAALTPFPPDVAVVVFADNLPFMTLATLVDCNPLSEGTPLTMAGFGCTDPNVSSSTIALMTGPSMVASAADAPHYGGTFDQEYFTSLGPGNTASPLPVGLCPGDSGGPVYRGAPNGGAVVGINSESRKTLSKIPVFNIFTRMSADDVNQWLADVLATGANGPKPTSPPAAPTSFRAEYDGYNSTVLLWDATTPSTTRITLTRNPGNVSVDLATDLTQYEDSGLDPSGKTYSYDLCFGNGAGRTCASTTWTTPDMGLNSPHPPAPVIPPGAPVNVTDIEEIAPNPGSSTVTWQPGAGGFPATYYVVETKEWYPASASGWHQRGGLLPANPTSDWVYLLTGHAYFVRVCAGNAGGRSCSDPVRPQAAPGTMQQDALTTSDASANLLLDSGFENQGNHVTVAVPWALEGPDPKVIDPNAGVAKEGTNNAYLRTATTNWNAFTQSVSLTPHTSYELTAWVQTSANVADGRIGLRHGSTAQVLAETKFAAAAGWTQVTVAFDSGTDTSATLYGGYRAPGADSWVRLDGFSLHTKPPPPVCVPRTCDDACGVTTDGCGHRLVCPRCLPPPRPGQCAPDCRMVNKHCVCM